ncbi:uncharacterized protein CEXT_124931 [Caerostris extrusa]|uniref:Uncharacterized protein n=1 Tax=Caerostris extrusa TaxID=172846 RepID=A0AAV4U4D4_CAEEX|nr:uncharacterized protein CEXT_124931 [Caerostris extrusa]
MAASSSLHNLSYNAESSYSNLSHRDKACFMSNPNPRPLPTLPPHYSMASQPYVSAKNSIANCIKSEYKDFMPSNNEELLFAQSAQLTVVNKTEEENEEIEDSRIKLKAFCCIDLCRVCEAWVPKASDSGNVSTGPENVLWPYLKKLDVSVRQIQGLIYFLCSKALKTTSSNEDKEIGLLSAKWYFTCLRVPDSSANAVFNSSLFKLCIDCIQIPDIDSQDAAFKWQDFETLFCP